MGGGAEHGHGAEGAHGDFRENVWSMTGGPYCRPKHWRRNTAIAMVGVVFICIPIAMKSAELQQRPHHPVRPIPSQLWCKNFGTKDYNEVTVEVAFVFCSVAKPFLYLFIADFDLDLVQ